MSQQPLPPDDDLTAIEAALGSLTPARSQLDRDRLMFQAGQASRRSSTIALRAWPAIAATLAAVAIGEAAVIARRPETRVVERLVVVREARPPTPAPNPDPQSAHDPTASGSPTLEKNWPATEAERLRWQILRFGLDALPEPSPIALQGGGRPVVEEPPTSGFLLRSEIAKLLKPGESS